MQASPKSNCRKLPARRCYRHEAWEPATGGIDNFGHLAHLHARDTSLVLVSTAPQAEIAALRRRMGGSIPWYTTRDDFNPDFGVTGGFDLNVFLRDDETVYQTYFTIGRGVEALGSNSTFLDLTPLGRQATREASPVGRPRSGPYAWWRLHDEYTE